ncbi:unnamed protein product [Closterium sp. Naga37s-1]|nr:unnamed protein product [Closterium sp. Naga37s-1]
MLGFVAKSMDRQYEYLQDQEGGGFASGWPATDQVPGQQQPHSSLPGQQQSQPGDQGFLDASNDRPAGQEGPGLSGRPAGGMVSAEYADEGQPAGGGIGGSGSGGGTGAGFAGKGVAGGASAAGGCSAAGGGSASRGESSLARILSLEELSTGELRFGRHAELDSAVGKAREGASGGAAGGLGEGRADQAAAGGGLPVVTVTGEERRRMVAALRDGRDRARDRTRHLQDALSRLDTWLNGVSMRRRVGRGDGANAAVGGAAVSAGGASGAAGTPGDNSRSSGSAGDGAAGVGVGAGGGGAAGGGGGGGGGGGRTGPGHSKAGGGANRHACTLSLISLFCLSTEESIQQFCRHPPMRPVSPLSPHLLAPPPFHHQSNHENASDQKHLAGSGAAAGGAAGASGHEGQQQHRKMKGKRSRPKADVAGTATAAGGSVNGVVTDSLAAGTGTGAAGGGAGGGASAAATGAGGGLKRSLSSSSHKPGGSAAGSGSGSPGGVVGEEGEEGEARLCLEARFRGRKMRLRAVEAEGEGEAERGSLKDERPAVLGRWAGAIRQARAEWEMQVQGGGGGGGAAVRKVGGGAADRKGAFGARAASPAHSVQSEREGGGDGAGLWDQPHQPHHQQQHQQGNQSGLPPTSRGRKPGKLHKAGAAGGGGGVGGAGGGAGGGSGGIGAAAAGGAGGGGAGAGLGMAMSPLGSVGVSEGGGEGDEEGYGGEEMDGEGGGGGREGGGLWPTESGSVGGHLGGAGESLGGAGGGAGGEAGGLSEVQSRGTGLAKVRRKDKKGKLGRVREKTEGGGGVVKEEGGGGGGGGAGGADGVRRQGRTGRLVAAGGLRLKKEAVSSMGSEGADDGGVLGSGAGGSGGAGGAASAAGGGGSGGGGSGGGGAGGVVGVANNVKQIRTSRLGLDKGERGGRVDRRNAANRVQRRMHADSPMEESGDSDDDAEELSNAIQAAMNTGAAAASSPFWKAVEPFFHFPAPEDLARLRQMSQREQQVQEMDLQTPPHHRHPSACSRNQSHLFPLHPNLRFSSLSICVLVQSGATEGAAAGAAGVDSAAASAAGNCALHALPPLMAVTPAGGNRSPAGGLEGAGGGLDGGLGGGGREWGGVVGESMVNRLLSALIDCPRQGGGKEGGCDGGECKDDEEEEDEEEEEEEVDFGRIRNSQSNSWQPNSGQIWAQMEGGRGPGGGLLGGGGGERGSGGGGPLSAEEWRGMGLEARVRLELAHVGLLRVHGLQEAQRQDDEISASLRISHRRLQVKAQHNQHKAAYLEEVVASRRLEEERSCEKLVVDRLLEMAYARRTGLKMAGAAGTITKGAGSSLKLARQSAVHFVRRALQRADQWHAGTLLPHLQRVHPDLQPSPSLLAERSPLPWTPGPGGVGTPGLGGVGRSSGVVTTPGGTLSAHGAAAGAAGAAGGAGAGGLDGSGTGLSGAGASAPGLLSLFNRQRLALFPPSPPRPPIPLSFAPTATTTAAAAAVAAAGADDTAMGGESPALEIAGLSPLRGAGAGGGGEEGGAGGAGGGGVREAEADSLVASMLIAGSPCDSFREGAWLSGLLDPHSRTNLRRSESRGERMGAMAGPGGDALEGSFRHKERTARLEDVFGAGGSPNDAVGAGATGAGGARGAAGASAAAGAGGGASRGGFSGAGAAGGGAGGGVSGGPVPLLPGNIKRKRTDRDNLDFTKGGSPARRTGEGGSAGATPTGARSSLAGGGEGAGGGGGGERKKGRWRQHRVGGGQRGAGGQAATPPVATPPGHDSGGLDPSGTAAAASGWEGAGDFDSKPLGSSPGDFFAPGSSLTHGIQLGKRSRGSGVGPGKSGKRKASADEFPDLDPNRNAMPTTPQPELEQVVELDNLAAGSVFGSAMPELGVQGDDFGGWLAGLPNDELLMGEDLGGLDGLAVPTDNLADLGF